MFGRFLSKAKTEEVTEAEFIAAMIKSGVDPDEAAMQAHVSKGLGSSVLCDGKMLVIKEPKS